MLKEIGQLASFLICARMLLYFRAKESYEKYIRLIISMMLLLLLVHSFLRTVVGNDNGNVVLQIKQYETEMDQLLSEVQPKEQDLELILQSLAERAVMENQAEESTEADGGGVHGKEMSEGAGVNRISIEQIEIGGAYGDAE